MTTFWFKQPKQKWPRKCKVKHCFTPKLRPHHHHLYQETIGEGVDPNPCICANPYIPGTREKRRGRH